MYHQFALINLDMDIYQSGQMVQRPNQLLILMRLLRGVHLIGQCSMKSMISMLILVIHNTSVDHLIFVFSHF